MDGVGKKGDGRGKNKVFRGTDSFEGCRLTVKGALVGKGTRNKMFDFGKKRELIEKG